MAGARSTGFRQVLANPQLTRLVAAHLLAVIAEWAAIVGVLVYAFEQGGAKATGLASLALLAPAVIGAPITASLTSRFRPQSVRRAGLLVQTAGYGLAAVAISAEAPVAVVVAAGVTGLVALCTLRPTGAVLLPSVVCSTSDLTVGNLWISHVESASALIGPLTAAGLLALGGPEAALAGCAAFVAAGFLVSTIGVPAGPPPAGASDAWQPGPALGGAVGTLRARPWTIGVVGVILARSAVLGAMDVILVVLALDALGLSPSGAGLLNALVGVGALASTAVAAMVVRRTRLAPWLAVGLALAAVLCAILGAETVLWVAIITLPLIGATSALLNGLARMLLQRSADPRVLGSLFALIELVGGLGLLTGSALAQILIAVDGPDLALFGLAAFLGLVLVASSRSVWKADAGADVPVVEMSLLREIPMFAPLPPLELEAVARSCEHVAVGEGEEVIRQGEPGDTFYAVAEGAFAIVKDGEHIRVAARGGCFGEVALLADVPRTATVTAEVDGSLLAVGRIPFLVAVTGRDTSLAAAWGAVREMPIDIAIPTDVI